MNTNGSGYSRNCICISLIKRIHALKLFFFKQARLAERHLVRVGLLRTKFDSPHDCPSALKVFDNHYDSSSGAWRIRSNNLRNLFRRNKLISYDAVEMEVGHFYYSFVRMTGVRNILETGVSRGYSTLCLAAALHRNDNGGHVWAIDPFVVDHAWDGSEVEDHISFIPKRSQDALPDVHELRFDLMVIDSLHDYETCVWEVINFEPQLKNGGYLILHDSVYFAGVQAVVQQLRQNPRFEVLSMPTPRRHGTTRSNFPGLTLVRKLSNDGGKLAYDERYQRWVIYPSRKKQDLNEAVVFAASEGLLRIPDSSKGETTLRLEQEIQLPDDFAQARFIEEGDSRLSVNELHIPQLVYVEHYEGETAIIRGVFSADLKICNDSGRKKSWGFAKLDEVDIRKGTDTVYFMHE